MRDLLLMSLYLVALLAIFKRPYIGALLMASIGFLNPQTLAWGFARGKPYAAVAVIVTVLVIFFNRDKIKFSTNTSFVFIYLFLLWGGLCTLFAFFPDDAVKEFSRFFKIQLSIFLTILLIHNKHKLMALVWTIALSLGFWGIKGGIFSILTGGSYRVWGARGSFIGGNNEIGLALLMTVPLLYYLFTQATHKWVRIGLIASMVLCIVSIVFTYSRGAFLGLIAMSVFLWWKSDKKIILGFLASIAIVASIPFIPDAVFDRLNTIENYQTDESAMGRINAWTTAYNLANDRLTGGGYRHTSELTTRLYSPHPEKVHDAHSIYFEVLGETGWVGLMLFFIIHLSNWFSARKIIKTYRTDKDKSWAVNLAKMIQVSLVAYYSGGAFLGLAYWDLPYYLMVIILIIWVIINSEEQTDKSRSNGTISARARSSEV